MEKVELVTDSPSEGFQIPVSATLKSNTYFSQKSPPPMTATLLETVFHFSAHFIFYDPKCIA